MINADDVQFHTPADAPYDWAETNFFSIYLPEPNITTWVYTVARGGVGAFVADVEAFNTIGDRPNHAIYIDNQQHLPMPDKLQSYSLPNGLSLETSNEPRDYHIRYEGHDDTSFDWHVRGLMEPYDITDPSMDPMATGKAESSGFGAAYASHFDMTVHITGTARIRGHQYDVDCVTTMDHSWGPRNESMMRGMGWLNAAFGDDYALSTIFARDLDAPDDGDAFTFAHGYALVDGRVRGLKSGSLRAVRRGFQMPVSFEMEVVDVDDQEHVMVGTPVGQHAWVPYGNIFVPFTQLRWRSGSRSGYGISQENCPMDRLVGRDFGASS